MFAKIFVYLFTCVVINNSVEGKTYKRCELIKELIEKHNFKEEDAAKVSCIAEGALFDTHRLNFHPEKVNTFFDDGSSSKPNFGIFQISSEFWCAENGVGGLCNVNCKKFLDDDISDDIGCLKKIIPSFNDDSWTDPWTTLIGTQWHCAWNDFLKSCAENKEEEVTTWSSLEQCTTNFPKLEFPTYAFGFNGIPALKHEFPHAAAIGWSQPGSNEVRWSCGGSLITEDTVLTAAHCTFNRENRAPDVVRLGDLNLETDDDQKDTQQFEVHSIIRHPEYKPRYNDIALIKLRTKVNVTQFVMPACLWDKQELPRDVSLEACGFGQTEFLGDISPILIKVVVSSLSTDICKEHYETDRKLNRGLLERIHLCAHDKSGNRMDTCEGDSGGPVEMKLQYVDTFIPFIVGVTAFGKGCGFDSPGVYTRVSSYITWIKENVPEFETDPLKCSRKYKDLRYYERKFYRSEFEPQKFVYGNSPEQKVPATIISDKFLLASASLLKKLSNPIRVQFSVNSSQILVEKIFYHPNHVVGKAEHDLALIKLQLPISWHYRDFPSCVTPGISGDYGIQQEIYNDPMIQYEQFPEVNITSDQSYCSTSAGDNFLCLKSDTYYVPGLCNVPTGSPITQNFPLDRTKSKITLVKGLAVQSRDCKFTLAIDVSKHYDWMNSVVFGSSHTEQRVTEDEMTVIFRDMDLFEGDVCVQRSGLRGVCKSLRDCSKKSSGPMLLCAGDTICC